LQADRPQEVKKPGFPARARRIAHCGSAGYPKAAGLFRLVMHLAPSRAWFYAGIAAFETMFADSL
jgi:hypothetical protein